MSKEKIKKNDRILVYDIETTGLDVHLGDMVLQIGVCELNMETGEIKFIYEANIREDGR